MFVFVVKFQSGFFKNDLLNFTSSIQLWSESLSVTFVRNKETKSGRCRRMSTVGGLGRSPGSPVRTSTVLSVLFAVFVIVFYIIIITLKHWRRFLNLKNVSKIRVCFRL